MRKISGEVVFVLFVVIMITFFIAGIQFGRLLERDVINTSGAEFTWIGVLENVTKELMDMNGLGVRRGERQNYFLPGMTSVGPWGGSGGQPFNMRAANAPRLHRIVLYHSVAIHSVACDYSNAGDVKRPPPLLAGPWDLHHFYGFTAVRTKIDLPSCEHIIAVEGTTGHFSNVSGMVITSLTFRTSSGRTYGPYGSVATESSHHFSIPAADGACIVVFWGRSGWLLDAIGVYIKPSCSTAATAPAAAPAPDKAP